MKRMLLVVALVLAAGCRGSAPDRARDLAHTIIIVDTHIDVPYRLDHHWENVSRRTESGNFDYVRAREGGLDAPFMSIYTPAELEAQGKSKALAEALIDTVETMARRWPDKFAIATSPDEVEADFHRGVMALCLGMENGSPIADDLGNVRHFYDRGVRYITLTHAKDNHICDSSYDTTRTWHGLSPFGREVVQEMNRVGIMIDVSHISDDAFWQVMDLTKAPVIASHSSCRHFVPGFERDMSDEMIHRVAQNGGVVQITFGSTFLTKKANDYYNEFDRRRHAWMDEHGYKDHDAGHEREFREQYLEGHPFPRASVSDVADHIDHAVAVAGIDHVGLGSDFDGVGDTLPVGLEDVSHYPDLLAELLRRGYSEADIEKIASGNILRVWRQVEQVAAGGEAEAPAGDKSLDGQ